MLALIVFYWVNLTDLGETISTRGSYMCDQFKHSNLLY